LSRQFGKKKHRPQNCKGGYPDVGGNGRKLKRTRPQHRTTKTTAPHGNDTSADDQQRRQRQPPPPTTNGNGNDNGNGNGNGKRRTATATATATTDHPTSASAR
jgi:hypothetical protein